MSKPNYCSKAKDAINDIFIHYKRSVSFTKKLLNSYFKYLKSFKKPIWLILTFTFKKRKNLHQKC